jgi:hypothetical protein
MSPSLPRNCDYTWPRKIHKTKQYNSNNACAMGKSPETKVTGHLCLVAGDTEIVICYINSEDKISLLDSCKKSLDSEDKILSAIFKL